MHDCITTIRIQRTYLALATDARCETSLLRTSKRYRLHVTIPSGVDIVGLQSPKSDYIEETHGVVTWENPFGDGL